MRLTDDESRALAFIAALLLLSAAARLGALPEAMEPPVAPGFDVDAHIAATERAVAEGERRSRPLEPGERLDPNTASEVELDRLPGVGPAVARAIVEARAEGRFRSVSELTRVPGVGARTVERLAPHLDLPATARASPAVGGVGGGGGAGGTLDLNRATAEALVSLPGIGPVLAERIVSHRDSAGPFIAVDSLLAVPGIGPATLDRFRALVRVR